MFVFWVECGDPRLSLRNMKMQWNYKNLTKFNKVIKSKQNQSSKKSFSTLQCWSTVWPEQSKIDWNESSSFPVNPLLRQVNLPSQQTLLNFAKTSKMDSDKSSQVTKLQGEIAELQNKLDSKQYKDEKQKKELAAEKAKKEEELK